MTLSHDIPALVTACLAALACALLGTFLVLRRQALMGDAISHAVLPGIVLAFLIAGTRGSVTMAVGAAIAGVVTTVLVEALCRVGRVDPSASMGVVFSILFALGIVMLVRTSADNAHVDADCVLYGQLEDVSWPALTAPADLLDPAAWRSTEVVVGTTTHTVPGVPHELVVLLLTTVVVTLFITLLFKELRITSFDPALATTLGMNAGVMHYALMVMTALAVVASFEAVGSILVVAMLICPPATARLLTDRLAVQVWLSAAIALLAAAGGYLLAAFGPMAFGAEHALSAAGMMAVVSGVLLAAAICLAPQHGIAGRAIRRLIIAQRIAREDLLALLYRADELAGRDANVSTAHARRAIAMGTGPLAARIALRRARHRGDVRVRAQRLALTPDGLRKAAAIVRTHRLWEHYLVNVLGLRPDHVHGRAETLEHITSPAMQRELTADPAPRTDPHDRPIPPAEPPDSG